MQTEEIETCLRQFEKYLLVALGYGIDFNGVQEEHYYCYSLGHGFTVVTPHEQALKGADLLAFAQDKVVTASQRLTAKRLMRLILSDLLGDYVLRSRELFVNLEVNS